MIALIGFIKGYLQGRLQAGGSVFFQDQPGLSMKQGLQPFLDVGEAV